MYDERYKNIVLNILLRILKKIFLLKHIEKESEKLLMERSNLFFNYYTPPIVPLFLKNIRKSQIN